MKLSVIAKEINATCHGAFDTEYTTVAIDSRKITGGELFVAVKGENLDGHDFIEQAIQNGAKAVLAARAPQTLQEKSILFLEVQDTTVALGLLAAYWRRLHPIPMIGLTGSCGKTTVKEMIATICKLAGKTLATKGNFNNHIGLPLTLLGLDASYQYAVIEMGANHMGEIGYLCDIAQPNISLITNVNPAHLQGFGSLAGVAKAKGEIYEKLPNNGIAILNNRDEFAAYWRQMIGPRKIISFDIDPACNVYATDIEYQPFAVRFHLHSEKENRVITLSIPGEHTVLNALAAAGAGKALGIPFDTIVKALESFEAVKGRLKKWDGLNGAAIFDDTYNANPGSMKAALEVLAQCPGERIFVMGDMGELGDNTITYHAEIGDYARSKGIEKLMAVGNLTLHAVEAFGDGAKSYPDKQSLVNDLKEGLSSNTVVLVKGSRSAGMEVITDALILGKE